MLEFAEYLPDLPAMGNPGATEAKNVLPWLRGYKPFPNVQAVTDALTGRNRGGIAVRDDSGNVLIYSGDETKLYSLSGNTHSDVTRSSGGNYALSDEENWEFIKFGETVIAINIDEDPQAITLGGSNFAALAGSPPKARHGAIVGNFVVFGNIDDGTARPQRVRWSGINDSTTWTPSADTQADFQDLYSDSNNGGGWIMGVTGGEYGIIFQEYSIWRMSYVGSPEIFRFDEVLPGTGTPCKNSITQEGRLTHFYGQDGFYELVDGTQLNPIGRGKVDDYFESDFDQSFPERVIGASDPTNGNVFWIYPGQGNSQGVPNKVLIYNWLFKKWSRAEIDLQWIFPSLGQGTTLEGLDSFSSSLDDLPASLDSRQWMGGAVQLAAYDNENKQALFSGTALDATLETAESDSNRQFLSGVRPLIDGMTTETVQVGTRDLQNQEITWSDPVTPRSDTGFANFRSNARHHRVRVNTSGDFTFANGVDVKTQGSGNR